MTDAETYLNELDRVLRWQPRGEQQRRLDAELTLWLGKLRADETGVAAAIVGGLTARRRAVLAARESAAPSRRRGRPAAQERR